MSSKIRNVTKLLRCLPYSSQFWIQRAICLQELGYPDLALGDAHKARSLAEAAFANASLLGTKVRLSSAMAELAVDPQAWKQEANRERRLASALKRAQRNAYDCLWTNLLRVGLLEDMFDEIDGFRKYSNLPRSEVDRLPPLYKSWRSMTLASPVTDQVDPDDLVRNGSIQPRAYPWMDQDMIVRSREVAESANATMRKDSASKCEVGQSPVKNEIDVWGVFASKPIKKGDVFLIDKSMAVIDNRRSEGYCSCGKRLPTQPVKPPCCNRSFCSEQCADRVLQTYHKVVCRKEFNFSNLPNEPGKRNRRYLETMLLIRLLAIITQHDKEHSNDDGHPLHGPIIKYLTPNYGAGQSAAWNFLDAIVHPTKILETLGVDVYADQRYDTWVLQTIRWRIANNAFSAVDGDIADVGYNGSKLLSQLSRE